MSTKRRQHSSQFKGKVALDALKNQKTLAELSSEHKVHSTQIRKWKQQLTEGIFRIFDEPTQVEKAIDIEAITAPLYQEIGRLKMENDWLKKKSADQ